MAPQPPRSAAAAPSPEQASLLSAEQLATRWQVPKAHVYRLAREGFLPTVRLGRYMRWRPEAIEAFEREGGAANE